MQRFPDDGSMRAVHLPTTDEELPPVIDLDKTLAKLLCIYNGRTLPRQTLPSGISPLLPLTFSCPQFDQPSRVPLNWCSHSRGRPLVVMIHLSSRASYLFRRFLCFLLQSSSASGPVRWWRVPTTASTLDSAELQENETASKE